MYTGKAQHSTETTHIHTLQSLSSLPPTIVSLDSLYPSLFEAEDEVYPEVEVVTDVWALQSFTALGGEVVSVCSSNRW